MNMYLGLWHAGIKTLRSFSEWAAFLAMLGLLMGLGYLCARTFGNPLERLSLNRVALFVVLVICSGLIVSQMRSNELQQTSSPYKIVSFELAKTDEAAKRIVENWGAAKEQARKELTLDFFFIVVYVLSAALICFWFAEQTGDQGLAILALTLGWTMPFAGSLDVIENIALLRILGGSPAALLAPLAFWCALPKLFVPLIVIFPCSMAFFVHLVQHPLLKR